MSKDVLFVCSGNTCRSPMAMAIFNALSKEEKASSAGISVGYASFAAENAKEAVKKYGDKIAVGADIADGKIAIKGWLEKSNYTIDTFMQKMQNLGVKTVICTDVSKDGAMKGANHGLYQALQERFAMQIIASGGVSSLADVETLAKIGVYGAIIGKAYYIGAIDLRAAIEVAK